MALKLLEIPKESNLLNKNKINKNIIFQLFATLFVLYAANSASIYIWRSIRGH